MWWRFRVAALGLFAAFGATSIVMGSHRPASEYSRERWGRENGFSWGAVTAIAQSADGYLWVGTERGLVRFDGYGFSVYENGGSGLKIGAVRQLLTDPEGNLWILLATTELLRYHGGKFEAGRDEAQFGITAIGPRKDGTVLFSSGSFGPLTYTKGSYVRLARNFPAGKGTGISQRNDTLSSRLSWATGVMPHLYVETDSPAASITETTDGTLWLGTRETGLFSLSSRPTGIESRNLLKEPVNCLLPLENGALWIGTDQGIVQWNGDKVTTDGVPKSLRDLKVVAMMRDREGNRWIATSKGLIRVGRADSDEILHDENTGLNALFEDREGNLWVGTDAGLERLRDNMFVTSAASGESRSGGAVYVDEAGRAWFAPLDGGLQWMKGEQSGSVANDGINRDVIYSISGRGNELWLGRQQGGLTRLEYTDGSLRTKTYTHKDGLAQDSVYTVYEGRDGTVWAGTLNGGVSSYSQGSFKTYTTADGMSSNSVTAIAERPDHSLWFATANGLDEFVDGRWRVFQPSDGLPSPELTCLLNDSAGTLWVGAKAGLAFLRSGPIQVPANLPRALQEETLGIAEDKFGWLWIATTNHVLKLNRDKLLAGNLGDSDLREYGLEDGLKGTEGVKRVPSVLADPEGNIWISTNRGVSMVDPRHALRSVSPVIVHIDNVSVDGTPVDLGSSAMLSEKPRRVLITFTGLSLSAPDRVQYKYKLESVDEKWSEPVKERQVTYSNLGSGAYRFVVMATNSQGVWNSNEATFQFRIAPAFWETWWFRVAIVAVCTFVIFLVYRLRMQAFTRRTNLRFEERLAERTRIAQELHDTLLQGFLSASMQLHVIADQLPPDSPAHPALTRVLGLIGRVIEEGRNAVRGLRATNPDLRDLGEALSRVRNEFPNQDVVAFRVLVEGTPRALHPVIRDEIYRIGYEALTNAFRHSQAENIEAELEYAADGLRLVVRDTGVGLNPQEPDRKSENHWGLTGMRERANKIGASFKILSRIGTGTEVDLWVPGQIVFLPSVRNHKSSWFTGVFGRSNDGRKNDL